MERNPSRGTGFSVPLLGRQSSNTKVPFNVLSRSKTLQQFENNESCERGVEQMFHRIASRDGSAVDAKGSFTAEQFRHVLINELSLPLAQFEVTRLFEHLDSDKRGSLSLEQFMHCVQRWRWLRRIIIDSNFPNTFTIPSTYDYEQSTAANYGQKAPHMVGDNLKIRWDMWHRGIKACYTPARQEWQDALIKATCSKTDPQPHPRIIYTIGGETVDHSYLMTWLSEMNIVPLEFVVRVNGGAFVEMMPEWKEYCNVNHGNHKAATEMCAEECSYIEMLAREVAMSQSQHVWVDASLESLPKQQSDTSTSGATAKYVLHSQEFEDFRTRFPMYNIAVLSVNKQTDHRDSTEGNVEPQEFKMTELPSWLLIADLIAHIDMTDPEDPILMRVEDMSGSWHRGLGRYFKAIQEQPGGFPYALSTLHLKTIPLHSSPTTTFTFTIKWPTDQKHVTTGLTPPNYSRAVTTATSSTNDHHSPHLEEPPPRACDDDTRAKRPKITTSDAANETEEDTKGSQLSRSKTWSLGNKGSSNSASGANSVKFSQITAGEIAPPRAPVQAISWKKKTLVTACSAKSAPTPMVLPEAEGIRLLLGADVCSTPKNNSPKELTDALRNGVQCWHVACHQDALCQGNPTLGLTDGDGNFALLGTDTLVRVLSGCSVLRGGSLELVVLNGCSSQAIAERLSEQAMVPFVICWASRVEDQVAKLFAEGFWEALSRGDSYEQAFEAGQLRVETELEDSFLDQGQHHISAMVPKYKLGVDPDDPEQVYERIEGDRVTRVLQRDVHAKASYPRIAAGIVRLITHKINVVQRAVEATVTIEYSAKPNAKPKHHQLVKRKSSSSTPRTPRSQLFGLDHKSFPSSVEEEEQDVNELNEALKLILALGTEQDETHCTSFDPLLGAAQQQIKKQIDLSQDASVSLELLLSPKYPVNLDMASREAAGIPMLAKYFSWLYPVKHLDHEALQRKCRNRMVPALVSLLCFGGYLYFDECLNVCSANAVTGMDCLSRFTVRFGDFEPLSYEDAAALIRAGRWHPVTLKPLKDAGALYFAWILPREQLSSQRKFPKFGAFAYLFRKLDDLIPDPRDRFFPIEES